MGDDNSVGGSCTGEVLASGILVVDSSRRFQKEENKPDLFLVSTGAGASSFFSTMRHPTGMSSGTSSDRFLTAISQSDEDPLFRMKWAIGLRRVIAECLVRRSDFVISFATAELANGVRGGKVCSGRNVSMRLLLWTSWMRAGTQMKEDVTYSPSTLSKPRLQLGSHSSVGCELLDEPSGHIFSENCSKVSIILAMTSGGCDNRFGKSSKSKTTKAHAPLSYLTSLSSVSRPPIRPPVPPPYRVPSSQPAGPKHRKSPQSYQK